MVGSPDAARLRDRLATLHRIVARSTGSVEGDRRALLSEALHALDLDFGSVAMFADGMAYPVAHLSRDAPNAEPLNKPTPAEALIANAVHERGETIAIHDLRNDAAFRDHLQVTDLGVRAYVGTPIRVAGSEPYVLTMGGMTPHAAPFAPNDLTYVELLAALLAQSLRDEIQVRSIERLAYHCRLTGLPMEERLRERVAQFADASVPVALVGLNVDIGRILDQYDYSLGASLVAAVARRVERTVRPPFAAYRGSDVDFFFVGRDADLDEAQALADAIAASLVAPFVIGDAEIAVVPTVGIALSRDGEPVDATIARAVAAVRDGKARAERARHAAPAGERRSRPRRLLDDLRRVGERDELVLELQPVVTFPSGGICGVEALVRWDHPMLGRLQPDEFIPLAEENESIVGLGTWVMRESARLAAVVAAAGFPIAVAFNVASAQLQDTAFIDRLRFATREAGIPASSLEIEITETAALRDLAAATNVLSECRALGVRVALDDFGTGYSSLSYLRDLPSDIVKIDRTFIGALDTDARAAAIASATIVLAHRLGRIVQAEGVETVSQCDWLHAEHCDRAQGYFFGEPVPVDVLLERLGNGSRQKTAGLRRLRR